jgi:hypothetical protein
MSAFTLDKPAKDDVRLLVRELQEAMRCDGYVVLCDTAFLIVREAYQHIWDDGVMIEFRPGVATFNGLHDRWPKHFSTGKDKMTVRVDRVEHFFDLHRLDSADHPWRGTAKEPLLQVCFG